MVIFATSVKFITKFNVLRCIRLSETLFWTGARGRIPIHLKSVIALLGPIITRGPQVNLTPSQWTLVLIFDQEFIFHHKSVIPGISSGVYES